MALGWCFPNALMQHALRDLEHLSIDQAALARRRDMLTATLAARGYTVLAPEGTFYLWIKWPEGDPERMWNTLADHDVFVMPGSIMNADPYFRICLTASDEMISRAGPAFKVAAQRG
jgi:aspartate aminotransferase